MPAEKPVLAVFLSSKGAPPLLGQGPRGRLPAYSYPGERRDGARRRRALRPLADAARAARALELGRFAESAIRAVVDRVARATRRSRCWLEPATSRRCCAPPASPSPTAEQVAPADARPRPPSASAIPLVAKAVAPGLLHKSDVGGVILGLESAAAVAQAVATLGERMHALGTHARGVLLQREVRGGIEALVGVTTDPTFGPLLVCGLGGVLVELLRDVAFRLTPVTRRRRARDARAGCARGRLLDGYRGMPPGDRDALVASSCASPRWSRSCPSCASSTSTR